jgi:hypothetical protein
LPVFILVLLVAVGLGISIVKAKDYYVIAPGSAARLTTTRYAMPAAMGTGWSFQMA